MKKYLVPIIIFVVVVALGLTVGPSIVKKITQKESAPPASETGGGGGGGTVSEPTKETSSIGKMTDKILIEVLAHASVYASVYAQNPSTYASKMNALLAKYGVTDENVKAYTAELQKDPQRFQEISSKYMQRAMELRNAGE